MRPFRLPGMKLTYKMPLGNVTQFSPGISFCIYKMRSLHQILYISTPDHSNSLWFLKKRKRKSLNGSDVSYKWKENKTGITFTSYVVRWLWYHYYVIINILPSQCISEKIVCQKWVFHRWSFWINTVPKVNGKVEGGRTGFKYTGVNLIKQRNVPPGGLAPVIPETCVKPD